MSDAAKIPDDLDIERLLEAVLDASHVMEEMLGPPGCSPDERRRVTADFHVARQALLDAIGRVRWRPTPTETADTAAPSTKED